MKNTKRLPRDVVTLYLFAVHACFGRRDFSGLVFGCYFLFLFIHRNYKFSKSVQETEMQYAYLSVTFRQHDNYTDVYDGKMANCCQKVRGKKANQRANNNKTKNKTNKQSNKKANKTTTKQEDGGGGV